MRSHLLVLVCSAVVVGRLCAGEPAWVPRIELSATFTEHTTCPVFAPGEPVRLRVRVDGVRHQDDRLVWTVTGWNGAVAGSGQVAVPKGTARWEGDVLPGALGAGSFDLHLRLERADLTLPKAGTRPAGRVSYAVLPGIEPLPLEHVDASRFGAQGEALPDASLWRLAGLRWIYHDRRPFDIARSGPDAYRPALEPGAAAALARSQAEQGLCLFVDAHSLPPWLIDLPAGTDTGAWTPSATLWWQAYGPRDHAAYGDLLGRIAAEQAAVRKAAFPTQRNGYYEIHWEPDWRWKGSDEAFIRMYETAHRAIRAQDPQGLLLGANYGVIETGNRHLERLFAQGLGRHLDGLVTHLYYLPMIERSPEQAGLVGEVRRLVAMARTHLPPGAPIINSEWGVHCADSFGKGPHQDPAVLRREAAWLLRGHLIALGEGIDTTFFFYTVDHTDQGGWGLFHNLTYPYPAFGTRWVAPKPAFGAVAAATRLLEGTRSLGAVDWLGAGAWGYAFDRGGRRLVALWSDDDAEREVALPCGAERVTVYDPMGNPQEAATTDGTLRIRLGMAPVYVLGLDPGVLPWGAPAFAPATAQVGSVLRATAPGGRLTLHLPDGPLAAGADGGVAIPRSLAPGRRLATNGRSAQVVGIEAPFSLALQARTGAVPLVATLANRTPEALPVQLQVLDRSGRPGHEQPVGLPASGTCGVDLPRSVLPDGTAAKAPVRVRGVDAHGVAVQASIELERRFPAARAARLPALDGSFGSWLQESFHRVEEASAVKIGSGRWSGPQDLSFRFAVAWAEQGLLLAVAVRDPSHLQTGAGEDLWKQDSLQVGIGLDRDPARGWRTFHKLAFARSSVDGRVIAYRNCGTAARRPGPLAASTVRCAVQRLGDETRYEALIPWRELDPVLAGPPPAGELGLGLLVNSVDAGAGGPAPRLAMEAFGGMAEQSLPDLGLIDLR